MTDLLNVDIASLQATPISNNIINIDIPNLTEPGVKYYIGGMLENSRNAKQTISNFTFNAFLFMGFIFFIGILLFVLYKDKTDPNKYIKQQYITKQIIEKTKQHDTQFKIQNKELITDLPPYQNEFENIQMRLL